MISAEAKTAKNGERVTTRKIGRYTYIVSSIFKEGRERDVVATIARLIQSENLIKPGAQM